MGGLRIIGGNLGASPSSLSSILDGSTTRRLTVPNLASFNDSLASHVDKNGVAVEDWTGYSRTGVSNVYWNLPIVSGTLASAISLILGMTFVSTS